MTNLSERSPVHIHSHTLEALDAVKLKSVAYVEGVHLEATAELTYSNATGESSVRTVDLKAYLDRGTTAFLVGHCYLRNDLRTFKVERISRLVAGGETVLQPDLQGWLRSMPRLTDQSRIDSRLEELNKLLQPFVPKYDEHVANRALEGLQRAVDANLNGSNWTTVRDLNRIAVHKRFSSGKLTKEPHIELSFLEYNSALTFLEDGTVVETDRFPRSNPWKLRSKPSIEQYFEEIDSAEDEFRRLLCSVTAK